MLNLRPDLQVENLRGNVETRLNAALEGRLDAVLLAEAGLNRLGLDGHITERLGPPMFLPAVGQGRWGWNVGRRIRGFWRSWLLWMTWVRMHVWLPSGRCWRRWGAGAWFRWRLWQG